MRITATDYAAKVLVWAKLVWVLHEYPDIGVEINIDWLIPRDGRLSTLSFVDV